MMTISDELFNLWKPYEFWGGSEIHIFEFLIYNYDQIVKIFKLPREFVGAWYMEVDAVANANITPPHTGISKLPKNMTH